MQLLKTGTHF